MARYAIIVGISVLNVVEADQDQAEAYAAREGGIAVASATASPGDSYSDGQFARPTPELVIPDEVEMWRARCVLIAHGKLQAVLDAIAAEEDPVRRALIAAQFEFRPTVRRLSPLTQMLQQAAGVSDEERDAWFVEAAAL